MKIKQSIEMGIEAVTLFDDTEAAYHIVVCGDDIPDQEAWARSSTQPISLIFGRNGVKAPQWPEYEYSSGEHPSEEASKGQAFRGRPSED